VKALVTGGSGFLGTAIVGALLDRGIPVTSLARRPSAALERLGVAQEEVDLSDCGATLRALRGHDVVFHAAAKTGVWGARSEFARVNVEGTRNVIEACRAARVERLVYTSSPAVCFDGRDHLRASNDLAYPERFLCAYAATKAAVERRVLAANGVEGLATCALRPHLIVGPGDPHLVPRILARARAGKLARVGDGANLVSLTDVENAALAHLDAALALAPAAAHAGKAYFIVQAEPVNLWAWIDELLARLEVPPVTRRISLRSAYLVGTACEVLWRLAGRASEPPMTRFLALQLARSHCYDLGPATRDFGYRERVSTPESMERLVRAFRRAG
jgi:nucleoside-diphosphate-sugar epimerase